MLLLCFEILNPRPVLSVIKDRNFKPKIFTDITMPAKQSYGPNIGKSKHKLE